eukprot:scaffold245183_cov33-Prasinocladus_malaysianus.AAC.3
MANEFPVVTCPPQLLSALSRAAEGACARLSNCKDYAYESRQLRYGSSHHPFSHLTYGTTTRSRY